MTGYRVTAYENDRILIKLPSGEVIEASGIYDKDTEMIETLSKAFGFSSPYFSYINRKVEDTYFTTQ